VLDAGSKLAEGTPRQVMDDPAVVEAYFGAAGRSGEAAAHDPGGRTEGCET